MGSEANQQTRPWGLIKMDIVLFPGVKVQNLLPHITPNRKVIPIGAVGYVTEVKENVVYINWITPDQFPGNEVSERTIGQVAQAQ